MKKFLLMLVVSGSLATVALLGLTGCQSQAQYPFDLPPAENGVDGFEDTSPAETEYSDVAGESDSEAWEKISEDLIFGYVDTYSNWVVDPFEPKNLIDETSVVVEARILSKETAGFFANGEQFSPQAYTPVNIEIESVLFGNADLKEAVVYIEGGDVPINDLIRFNEEYYPRERNEKMGLYDLSDEEKSNLYMSYNSEESFDFSKGGVYTLILSYDGDFDAYIISSGGYGVFEKDGSLEYTNVLTGKSLNIG